MAGKVQITSGEVQTELPGKGAISANFLLSAAAAFVILKCVPRVGIEKAYR
jgi:hypothetical protein